MTPSRPPIRRMARSEAWRGPCQNRPVTLLQSRLNVLYSPFREVTPSTIMTCLLGLPSMRV